MILFGRDLSDGPPLCIAEISGNHRGDLNTALRLIELAKESGADAVKIQAYDADSLTIDCDGPEFQVQNPLWAGQTLYQLYQQACTPLGWMPYLFKEAAQCGIPIFSSVFCERGLATLEQVGCPAYKIASMEITDTPLIEKVAATGKPVIISTGMASNEEVYDAAGAVAKAYKDRQTLRKNLMLLHCVSGYPTPPAEAELNRLEHLQIDFGFLVGLSDHTLGITVPIAATALGARIIEKHFTDSRAAGGPDAAFSLEPAEFATMVRCVHDAWAATAPQRERNKDDHSEASSRQLRRSLYAVADIKAGQPFTTENVRSIRPSHGLPPAMLPEVLTKKAACDIARGTALKQQMLGPPSPDRP